MYSYLCILFYILTFRSMIIWPLSQREKGLFILFIWMVLTVKYFQYFFVLSWCWCQINYNLASVNKRIFILIIVTTTALLFELMVLQLLQLLHLLTLIIIWLQVQLLTILSLFPENRQSTNIPKINLTNDYVCIYPVTSALKSILK